MKNWLGQTIAGLRAKACKALASKGDHDPALYAARIGDCRRKRLKGCPQGGVIGKADAIAVRLRSDVKTVFKLALVAPLIALALTGCATTHSYTPTYCLTKGQLETLKGQEPPKVKSGLSGKADHDLEVVAGSAIRLRAWGDGLITVLGGCVDPNKP